MCVSLTAPKGLAAHYIYASIAGIGRTLHLRMHNRDWPHITFTLGKRGYTQYTTLRTGARINLSTVPLALPLATAQPAHSFPHAPTGSKGAGGNKALLQHATPKETGCEAVCALLCWRKCNVRPIPSALQPLPSPSLPHAFLA